MSPCRWTPAQVRAHLVDAFRILPGAPVRPGSRRTVAEEGTVVAALNWPSRFLADDSDGWRFLLVWAQCRAAGDVVEERRRAMGWSHARFQKGAERAAATIAAGLNRSELRNVAAIEAAAEAGERLAGRMAAARATA